MKSSTDSPSERNTSKMAILHVLFNQRWKILLTSLLISGAIAGVTFKNLLKPTFTSHAEILIRYVVERAGDSPGADQGADVLEPDSMETEKAILASYDLASEVAKAIGPDKLSCETPAEAAQRIASGLKITSQPDLNVVDLSYRDRSPDLAREVLETLIQKYFTKHLEIHRSSRQDDFAEVIKLADQAHGALRETEEKIRQLKEQADSMPNEAEKLSDLNARIRELEERRQMEAEEFRIHQTNLEKARNDEVLDRAKVPNIGIIQAPTTPLRPDG